MTDHQQKQRQIIDNLEQQIHSHNLRASTVSPTDDFEHDPRICLTSVHMPRSQLTRKVFELLIVPLTKIEPDFYFYSPASMHMTVKNIRVIANPPHFTNEDVMKAKKVCTNIIPKHFAYSVYFYRLLLFPNNLSLVATTDPQLDDLVFDLDAALRTEGIPDDKVYSNSKYFFCNLTLARFNTQPSEQFKQKIMDLSKVFPFEPYVVDSVTLVQSNAVFKDPIIEGEWTLQRNNS